MPVPRRSLPFRCSGLGILESSDPVLYIGHGNTKVHSTDTVKEKVGWNKWCWLAGLGEYNFFLVPLCKNEQITLAVQLINFLSEKHRM